MDPQEGNFIRKWHTRLDGDLQIRLVLTEDKRREDFSAYADRFSALAPAVFIRREDSDTLEMAAMVVGGNIYFHALPSGKELEPWRDRG
jgi:hypothetical protein